MKTFIALAGLVSGVAYAQVPTVSDGTHAQVRAATNAALTYLDGKQLKGAGAPGVSVSCDASTNLGVVYVRTDAGAAGAAFYVCTRVAAGTYGWDGPYGSLSALASVATSGAYSDLSGKPTIPTVASTASILKGNGSGGAVAATPGTDYQGALGYTPLAPNNNLSDVQSASAARSSLGLGTAATQSTSVFAPATTGANVLKGNGSGGFASAVSGTDYQAPIGFTPLNPANNLSDVASVSASRTALGLGAAAVKGVTGTGSTLSAIAGTLNVGHCINIDASFNLADAGAICGTVTSVALAGPSWLSVSGSPVTGSGTFTLAGGTGLATNQILGTGASGNLTLHSLLASELPTISLGGDVTGTTGASVVARVNGTTVPTNTAADQALLSTGIGVGGWVSLPTCLDASGNHLNYSTSTHAFSCGATASFTTSGTNGQALTSNGSGGLGTPVTLAASATTDTTVASNITSGTLGAGRLPTITIAGDVTGNTGASTVAKINGVSMASLSTGLVKNTISTGVPSIAVPGTDYATATNGTGGQALTSNGSGGFGTAVTLASSATVDATNASNIASGTLPAARLPGLTGDATASSGSNAVTVVRINGVSLAGLSTGILKNTNGTGSPSIAAAGTDYAGPTNGTTGQGLVSNGAGGFGTPVTLANSATTDATNAGNISSGVLAVARGGTGTSSPGIVAGSNVTVTGTWPNQTIAATSSGGGSGLPDPGANGVVKRTALNTTAVATAADVVGLFSTCSGTQYLGADGACHSPAGAGTVTSVAMTAPSWLTVGGSPVTSSGTLALSATGAQTANQVLATPNGSTGAVGLRSLGAADLPTTVIAQKFLGTSAPGSVAGNLPGDLFTDTTAHNEYVCNAVSGTSAPACTSVSTAGWLLVNGGAGLGFTPVNKAGDTMTGALGVTFSDNTVARPLTLKNTNTGTSAVNGVQLQDSAGANTANFTFVPGNFSSTPLANKALIETTTVGSGMVFHSTSAGNVDFYLGSLAAANSNLHLDAASGKVGIGNNSPAANLDVAGTINATGNLTAPNIPQKFLGTAAPGSVAGNVPGDEFTDTTNHNAYRCNAPSGTSAPACTSVSSGGWLLLNTAGGGGGGVVLKDAAGTSLGTATSIQFPNSTGMACIPNVSGGNGTVQCDADTAVLETRAAAQVRAELNFIPSTFASSTYTGTMTPTLTSYGTGNLMLHFWPNVNGPGGSVGIVIDGLNGGTAIPLKQGDCVTNTSSTDVVAGRPYSMWLHATTGTVDAACLYNTPAGSSSGGGTWGSITGTLSAQSDLNTALGGKVGKTGDTMTGALNVNFTDNAFAHNISLRNTNGGTDMKNGIEWRNTSGTSIGDMIYFDTNFTASALQDALAVFTYGTATKMIFGTNPVASSAVAGDIDFTIGNTSLANSNLHINGTSGKVGIGNNSPSANLTVTGNISASTDITARHYLAGGSAPSITSGFGTTPAIAGSDDAGRVTIGTGGTATTGIITFASSYANAPACVANNETTIAVVQAVATTTTLTLNAASAFAAGAKLTWICKGF